MSWVIFAGSAQIAATQLFASGAPLLVILATAAIVNLRFLMYAASLATHFRARRTALAGADRLSADRPGLSR
jgi:predicted branched-subunit amino acid permease